MLGTLRTAVKQAILQRVHHQDERLRQALGPHARGLTADLWDLSAGPDGHLSVQGVDATELAKQHGTPLYVVDEARLRRNYEAFLGSFTRHYPKVEIGYSYKTNPLPGVLKALHGYGATAEVISHFELWLALRLGVPPERIIFNGPAKTPESLELAVKSNIKLINIDNFDEIEQIARLAEKYQVRQQVAVRVITTVGWSAQFGLGIRNGQARAAFEEIKRHARLEPCGLHVHLGTGIKDIETYLEAIKQVLEFGKSLESTQDLKLRFFDFGGGFGVPTVRPYTPWDVKLMANGMPPRAMDIRAAASIEQYGARITELFKHYHPAQAPDGPTMIFEPGRAITSSAQFLLLSVLAIKPADSGVPSVILDGGKNITMPLAYEYHEILSANHADRPRDTLYNLFGPLCHPSDIIARYKHMPALDKGDVVAIMDAGAYFVPNQMNFSNPRPAAVMVTGGRVEVIRSREQFDDIVACDAIQPARGPASA